MDASTIVGLVIAVLVIEVVVLAAMSRRCGRLPRLGALLPNLAAGLLLVMALRSAVYQQGVPAIGACVALGGIAHLLDLRGRSKG